MKIQQMHMMKHLEDEMYYNMTVFIATVHRTHFIMVNAHSNYQTSKLGGQK
jgi:hypothetical protein